MGTTIYNGMGLGGLGGYVRGETIKGATKYLAAGQTLYVYCGGAGVGWNNSSSNAGGWNGGGPCQGGASGGGGATDIRLTPASTTDNRVWNNSSSFSSRIIVAGGGGGSNDKQVGGYGGLTGGTGEAITGQTAGTGGSQTAGGQIYGAFGYCNDLAGGSDGGGGGGGWYGGGRAPSNSYGAAGGGGSSYISGYTSGGCSTNSSLSFNNSTATAINGNLAMPDPLRPHGNNRAAGYSAAKGNNSYGNMEIGYARITLKPYD